MKVIEVSEFGGPDVLKLIELPDPPVGPGQALVEVAVVSTLFIDTQIRAGAATAWFPTRPPFVPGVGFGGTVAAVGPGVDPGWVGRQVVADTGAEAGGYAERAVVEVAGLVPIPDGLGLPAAAALLHDGRTALRLADTAELLPGRRVLVTAAAGGL